MSFLDRLGKSLSIDIQKVILVYMLEEDKGVKTAEVFRACGLDWCEQISATSSNQNYWVVGALRDIENRGLVIRQPHKGGLWYLTDFGKYMADRFKNEVAVMADSVGANCDAEHVFGEVNPNIDSPDDTDNKSCFPEDIYLEKV